MSHEAASKAEFVRTAAELRGRAARLATAVAQMEHAADLLEAEITGGEQVVLRGRDIVDELLNHWQKGETLHYQEAARRLAAAGFAAGGVDPTATLLAQINRAPEFERTRRRSGRYLRVELSEAPHG